MNKHARGAQDTVAYWKERAEIAEAEEKIATARVEELEAENESLKLQLLDISGRLEYHRRAALGVEDEDLAAHGGGDE